MMSSERVHMANRALSLRDWDDNMLIIFTPPKEADIHKFAMAKIVLFNEFAKAVNVTLDDIFFAAKILRNKSSQMQDMKDEKTKPPVCLFNFILFYSTKTI